MTLFHRVTIPFSKFDSGLLYVDQPEETSLQIDWISLELDEPKLIDDLEITSKNYPIMEASIYLGSAHNWCEVTSWETTRISENKFSVKIELDIDFENERVAQNESLFINTTLVFL